MDLSGMLSELDGPVVRFVSPVSYGNALAVVGGELDLNGSCLTLGGTIPIVWPAGTRWDPDIQAVISSTGETMSIGSEVKGGGGYVPAQELSYFFGPSAIDAAEAMHERRERGSRGP